MFIFSSYVYNSILSYINWLEGKLIMITTLITMIVAMVALMLMMVAMMSAVLSIVVLYTGKGATYDRAGNKMAKTKSKASKKAKKANKEKKA